MLTSRLGMQSDNMRAVCSACSDLLPPDNNCVKCFYGGCKLHFECAGISERTYRTMGSGKRDEYKCRLCRIEDDSGSVASVESDSAEERSAEERKSSKIFAKKVMLESLFLKLDSMERNLKNDIDRNAKIIQKECFELKASIQLCSDRMDDFVREVVKVNKGFKED